MKFFKTKSVVYTQIPIKVDVTYHLKLKKKYRFICVIGSQIHFEVTKILRILLQNLCEYHPSWAQVFLDIRRGYVPEKLTFKNTKSTILCINWAKNDIFPRYSRFSHGVNFTNILWAQLRQFPCAVKIKPLLQAQKSFAQNFGTKSCA